ncbi:MAG: ABC transporter permease [Rhodobacteraceae bacterium]|nr:ABC transporter permease [Paracoccaceae bacterium]MBR9821703.1 ABC transporter permease [Paracoccaceae bacterium]
MSSHLVTITRSLVFVCLALLLCAALMQGLGFNALLMLTSVAEGAFLRPGAIENSLRWGLPLFLSAAGVSIAFRAGFFNIGAQGQFYLGAIFAATAAHWLQGGAPLLVIPAILCAGFLGGALWALWPGLMKLGSGTDEVITTLMGNFIAGLLLVWVTSGPLKDPAGSGQQASSPVLAAPYRISDSSGVSATTLGIALGVGILLWLLVNRTAFGVLSGLAGRNGTMVRWQGASSWRIGLTSFLLSGGLAGLAGAVEFAGPTGRIASGFLPGHGFTATLVALVANFSILGTAVTALFFGGLAAAALYLPIMAGLPAAAIEVINASIALFITARSRLVDRLAGRKETSS